MVCFACRFQYLEKLRVAGQASIERKRGHAIEQLRPSGLHLKIFALQRVRSRPVDSLENLIGHMNPLGKIHCAVLGK